MPNLEQPELTAHEVPGITGVTRIIEPFVEILYGDKTFGNVDTRRFYYGADGSTQENDRELAYANRQKLLGMLTVRPTQFVVQRVKMSSDFVDLSEVADIAPIYDTDALIVDRPGVAAAINPADCNVVTMHDATYGRAMAQVHLGWQGLEGGIHHKVLDRLADRYGVLPEDLRVHFAPSIRKKSYRYTSLPPRLADARWQPFIEQLDDGTSQIDLVGRIVSELKEAGIAELQMEISPVDVGEDENFFSHARSFKTGEPEGRNGVISMLRGEVVDSV